MATLRIDAAFARRRTAEVMARAQRDIPLFHVSKAARVDALRDEATSSGASLTVALLPVVARWLTRHPLLNAHWEDGLKPRPTVDLGVAWSHRENVLIVPVLADCGSWELPTFAQAMADLKQRSADDAFRPADFRAPSFTLSNLGAAGIESFTSLVTPPQVAVLSVSATVVRATETNAALVAEYVLPLTLGVDHRAVDGAYAARALADLTTSVQGAAA